MRLQAIRARRGLLAGLAEWFLAWRCLPRPRLPWLVRLSWLVLAGLRRPVAVLQGVLARRLGPRRTRAGLTGLLSRSEGPLLPHSRRDELLELLDQLLMLLDHHRGELTNLWVLRLLLADACQFDFGLVARNQKMRNVWVNLAGGALLCRGLSVETGPRLARLAKLARLARLPGLRRGLLARLLCPEVSS